MTNIRKRYASDCSTSDLRDDERHHNTDSLAAVALGASAFGAALLRAKHAQHTTMELIETWREMVLEKAIKKGWANIAEEVADISLWHYLDNGICQTCNGRGAAVIAGSPILADVVCVPCAGTGHTPRVFDTHIREGVMLGLQMLASIESRSASGASWKIK
jgi:hypothetical protein